MPTGQGAANSPGEGPVRAAPQLCAEQAFSNVEMAAEAAQGASLIELYGARRAGPRV
jgi:hypothetical protein